MTTLWRSMSTKEWNWATTSVNLVGTEHNFMALSNPIEFWRWNSSFSVKSSLFLWCGAKTITTEGADSQTKAYYCINPDCSLIGSLSLYHHNIFLMRRISYPSCGHQYIFFMPFKSHVLGRKLPNTRSGYNKVLRMTKNNNHHKNEINNN